MICTEKHSDLQNQQIGISMLSLLRTVTVFQPPHDSFLLRNGQGAPMLVILRPLNFTLGGRAVQVSVCGALRRGVVAVAYACAVCFRCLSVQGCACMKAAPGVWLNACCLVLVGVCLP
jgi:hypothetical protein